MILETVRIIADWLSDATYGINAVRTAVPKDTGVTDFPAVTILDSTRDGRVARGGVPNLNATEFPCLLVSPADEPVTNARPAIRPYAYQTATVLIRYATTQLDAAMAERNASQSLKCVYRQLAMLTRFATDAQRTRADVQLYDLERVEMKTLYESADDTLITGGVLVTCLVRNTDLV